MTDLQDRIQALPPEKRARLERMLAANAAKTPVDQPIPARTSAEVRLSFAQRREWLTDRLRHANNMRGAVRLSGRLDVELLRRIVRELVARHEVLRTNVQLRAGTPVAVVRPPGELDLPVVDLTGTPTADQPAEIERLVHAEAHRPFDVESDVLLRGMIIRLAADEHILLLTTHHMASDGWSQGILVTEIAALHEAFTHGDASPLPPPALQYADFAAWQTEQLDQGGFRPHLEYWRDQLSGMPPRLALPTDRPRPPEPSFSGATYRHSLSATAAEGVDRLVRQLHASPFMVLLAALKTLLYRFTGQTDIVIGAPIAGRNRPELEPVMGCFVNVLLLRTRLAGADTFHELLTKVRTATLDGYEHQDLPYERLVDELQPRRERAATPLIQMLFNFDNLPLTPVELTGVTMTPIPVDWDGVNVELALLAQQDAEGTRLVWQYDTELFEPATVADLSAHLERVLEAVVAAPEVRLDDIPLADTGLSTTDVTTPPSVGERVHRAVERWTRLTPNATAAVCAGQTLSYGELDRRANRIAHLLRDKGIGRGAVVGVRTGSSFRLVEAVLGVLKAGAAFLPLDRRDPAARTRFVLDELGVALVLTDEDGESGVDSVVLDERGTATRDHPATDPGVEVGPRDIAYVIYTSGSTGTPKGVLVEHRALAEYARCFAERVGITPGDRFLQFASPGFDVLVEELFPTWLAGAAVVTMPDRATGGGPADLVRLLAAERVTLAELPTALWHEWSAVADRPAWTPPESLRMVIVGGERVLPDRLASWAATGVPLTHVYGLTETTVTSTTFTPAPGSADWTSANLPIGVPLPNTRPYVLDARLRPVPHGAPGELFLGGSGLARGYVDRPGSTAVRFLPDPFAAEPGARMYRTGDLVRQRPDGNLEFLSRVDRQVKIRGYRIELAEIETALVRCPGVRQAVVTVREVTAGDRRLVAHVVAEPDAAPAVRDLRRSLERALPAFMVPSAFQFHDTIPVTSNGKIDLDGLAASVEDTPAPDADFVAPALPRQQRLAALWAQVIGVERVGLHDNFFELGGDSILAIQIAARAEVAGIRVSPSDIFQHPTVAELADVAGAAPRTDSGPVTGPFPPLPLQRWFFAQRFAEPHHWNLAVLLEVDQSYGVDRLRSAFDRLVAHHDGLRQRFTVVDNVPHAEVVAAEDQPVCEHIDLRGRTTAEQDAEVQALGARAQASLDLAAGPLVRALLFELGHRPHRLLVLAHHLVVDGVSWRILFEDLRILCEGAPLPTKTTSLRTWAERLDAHASTPDLAAQVPFWTDVARTPVTPLPVDHAGGRAANTVESRRRTIATLEPAETEALLRQVPAMYHTQVNDVLLAALARTLTGWTGSAAHVIDLEGHGRDQLLPDLTTLRTVGWLSVVHPVVLDADLATGPGATLKATKERLRQVPGGGVGWNLLRYSAGDRHPEIAAAPPAELVFNYLGQFDSLLPAGDAFRVADDVVGPTESPRGARPYLLEVSAVVTGGALRVQWLHSANAHRDATVERLAARYLAELHAIVAHCAAAEKVEHTPSDFPGARLSQAELDTFLSGLPEGA